MTKLKRTVFSRRAAAAGILAAALLSLSGCQRIKDAYGKLLNQGEPPVPQTPVFAVNTMSAVKGQIRDYLMLSGDIIAASTVDAYSDAAGKVSRLLVSVGNWVNKGDVIALVDPSRPGMEYVESEVKAPISGTVVALPAQLGMTVSQQVPLARISGGSAASGGLEIHLYVSERFISRISLRQLCEISLDAWPGELFQGRVSEISPTVDPASRTMEIKVRVDNSASRLKAGMFAKVKVITEQKAGIVKIPHSALIQRFGEDYVFVAEADPENPGAYAARKRIIVPGIIIDGIMEVRQGLSPDDDIIVSGQTLLDDGAKVNIINRVTPLSVN
ncbi:MAG: efflux RND transporter periplasmic adaptor subunit [Treponema sp.]|jgi:multidrug efflux pump subunit AcrA (membrane-fusion protein)|nr:efflux RND transporter periplasmic adaptor subunit [Treponema sp.]